jgi:hypothetical protein
LLGRLLVGRVVRWWWVAGSGRFGDRGVLVGRELVWSMVGWRCVVGSGRFGNRCVLLGRRLVQRVVGWWCVVGSRRFGSRGVGCWCLRGRQGAGGCWECRGSRRLRGRSVQRRGSTGKTGAYLNKAERASRGDCAAADGIVEVR